MRITAAVALLLLALSQSASQSAPWQVPAARPFQPVELQSYVDLRRLWPRDRRPIAVCWETGGTDQVGRKWVEDGIHEIFEKASVIRFVGTPGSPRRWPRCGAASLGIRIAETSGRPRSLVGWQGPADIAGVHRPETATTMQLNFGSGIYHPTCSTRRQQCTRYLAAHEFAHAIGFLHEHLRSDASADCKALTHNEADDPGYSPAKVSLEFDPKSITNYCANIFANPMPIAQLSQWDVRAINQLYGPH